MRLALVLEYFVEWVDADPNFRSFEYGGKPLGHRAVICIHDMHGPGHHREIDPQQVLSYNHLHMAVAKLADMRQRYEAEEAEKSLKAASVTMPKAGDRVRMISAQPGNDMTTIVVTGYDESGALGYDLFRPAIIGIQIRPERHVTLVANRATKPIGTWWHE